MPWPPSLLAIAGAAAVGSAALIGPAGAAHGQGGAAVAVDRTGTAAGEEIVVSGSGWSAGTRVVVELCGQEGRNGSVDCDVSNQRVAGVDQAGAFRTPLRVGRPPSPCPCVVRAVDQRGPLSAWARIAVQGLPTVPIDEPPPEPVLSVSSVKLMGLSWPELFAARPRRTLRFTIANGGGSPVDEVRLRVAVGRGSNPSGVVDVPAVEDLQPGEQRRVEVPVELDGPSFGRYTARVEARGPGERAAATATTSSYPWGLLLVPVVLVQLVLLGLRNRVRRRIVDEAPPDDLTSERSPDPEPEPGADAAAEATPVLDVPVPVEPAGPQQPLTLEEVEEVEEKADVVAVQQAVDLLIGEHRRAVEEVLRELRREAGDELSAARDQLAHAKAGARDALRFAWEQVDAIVSLAVDAAGEIIELAGDPVAEGGRTQDAILTAAVEALDRAGRLAGDGDREVEDRFATAEEEVAAIERRIAGRRLSMGAATDVRFAALAEISGDDGPVAPALDGVEAS